MKITRRQRRKSPVPEPILDKPSKFADGATMTEEKPSVKEKPRKIKESYKEQEAGSCVLIHRS